MVARDAYHQGIAKLGMNFDELPVAEQIQKLQSIEKTHFFQLLRAHTIEGMFSDPMHGGNAGLIGWQLVGYPGPRMSYKEDIDQHFGTAWRPKPADHAASGEALGGRKSVAGSIPGDGQSRSIAAFSPSSTSRRDSDGRLPSLLVSLVRSNVVT